MILKGRGIFLFVFLCFQLLLSKGYTVALHGWLSWLEHHPDTASFQVQSLVREHARVNHWVHKRVGQQTEVLLSVLSSLSEIYLFFKKDYSPGWCGSVD